MTRLLSIGIRGESSNGSFEVTIEFAPGLQVFSGENTIGKSLTATSIAWCLGLEPLFGAQPNDPSRLPLAVREELTLNGAQAAVVHSEATLRIQHFDGRRLSLTRSIKGGDLSIVRVDEESDGQDTRSSVLSVRTGSMKDPVGGFQYFLFSWFGWPPQETVTFEGRSSVYLENLAPLFFIDQTEGWSTPQALQIRRYGQQQITDIALDYVLGDIAAVEARVERLKASQQSVELKEEASALAARIDAFLLRHGWQIDWSANGSIEQVARRWGAATLKALLLRQANVDFLKERDVWATRADDLRQQLTKAPADRSSRGGSQAASQKVIELKERRHQINQGLADARRQREDAETLLEGLEHRLRAAQNVLRLKTTGVGRLDQIECPTCHQDVEPGAFELREHSTEMVSQHIEALMRDRLLIKQNVAATADSQVMLASRLELIDRDLAEAMVALDVVNEAVGVREQLAKIAVDLAAAERRIERFDQVIADLKQLETEVAAWVRRANAYVAAGSGQWPETARAEFVVQLRHYLLALGHNGVSVESAGSLRLEESVPYLGSRRLSTLGSASDQPRLVAAYALAVASTAHDKGGNHPGFVVLDEPLQQNPDEKHRKLFISFLQQELARTAKFQTIIFTSLHHEERAELVTAGVPVTDLGDAYLLRPPLLPPPEVPEAASEE